MRGEIFGFVRVSAGCRAIVSAFFGVHPCVHIIFVGVRKDFNLFGIAVSAGFARKGSDAFRFLGGFGCNYPIVELVREFLRCVGVFLRGTRVPVTGFVR